MKFVVFLVFICVGFALSFHRNPAIHDDAIISEEVNEAIHNILKKSISAHPPDLNKIVNPEGTVQEPCRLTIPTLELSANEFLQDLYSDDTEQEYLPTDVIPPRIPSSPYNVPLNNWTPYDFDYFVQEPTHYRAPYNSFMPYIYSNPVPSVRSLPPVISTHIHDTIPEAPEIDDRFDMSGLSDSDYFAPYVRAVRSKEEDFLDQLEKDAMMPNLLPTMPFPYMRSAQNYQAQYGEIKNIPVATFPPGSGDDCALPFLVSCSPNIFHGTLTQNSYARNPLQSLLATYRNDGTIGLSHEKAR